MSYNGNQDSMIDAGKGIKPDAGDWTQCKVDGVTGSDGPGQDNRIPAGEGISPGAETPFSKK